jgi:hypothetical protein
MECGGYGLGNADEAVCVWQENTDSVSKSLCFPDGNECLDRYLPQKENPY